MCLPKTRRTTGLAIGAGAPPGPFVNRAVFRGVFDSPTAAPTPPPGTQTFGSNAANDFPSATIDNAGNIYAVWATQNARTNQMSVWFASSHDHGQNFYGPFEVAKFPAPSPIPRNAAPLTEL